MDFKTYIEREGKDAIAAVCGVTPRAVEAWRYRQRRPQPHVAPKLIAYAKGDLTWEDIYPPKGQA